MFQNISTTCQNFATLRRAQHLNVAMHGRVVMHTRARMLVRQLAGRSAPQTPAVLTFEVDFAPAQPVADPHMMKLLAVDRLKVAKISTAQLTAILM
jgi:hypothetical protein